MTQGMDQMLAGFFGTGGAEAQPSAEDAEKVAQAEFFAKTAAANGYDLTKLSEAQIEFLWSRTFANGAGTTKVAEFPPKPEGKPEGEPDEKKDRDEAARKEHEEKKAGAERFEQATYFGKTAAHAYVAEMKNIIAAGGLEFMKEGGIKERVGKGLESVGRKIAPEATAWKEHGGGVMSRKLDPKHVGGAAAGAAGAAAAAGGAAAHHATKEKKGSAEPSAFEMAAAELALAKVAEAQFDQDQAMRRLNAVLELGLNDSEKVASLEKYEDAIERRALEYASAAGYPVEWTQ